MDVQGRADTCNPAEQFLAALAACMIKSIGRVSAMIPFQFDGLAVTLGGARRGAPPMIAEINDETIVATLEDDWRFELLHANVHKYDTISNTVAKATKLEGTIRRTT